MNPISRYFEWHDTKYLARAENPLKNQFDIRLLQVLRVVLLITSALGMVVLVAALFNIQRLPGWFMPMLAFLLGFSLAWYTWVSEALLFRRYIEQHRHQLEKT